MNIHVEVSNMRENTFGLESIIDGTSDLGTAMSLVSPIPATISTYQYNPPTASIFSLPNGPFHTLPPEEIDFYTMSNLGAKQPGADGFPAGPGLYRSTGIISGYPPAMSPIIYPHDSSNIDFMSTVSNASSSPDLTACDQCPVSYNAAPSLAAKKAGSDCRSTPHEKEPCRLERKERRRRQNAENQRKFRERQRASHQSDNGAIQTLHKAILAQSIMLRRIENTLNSITQPHR